MPANRGGAPLGNQNAARNGTRISGSVLPDGYKPESNHVQRLARLVREAYESRHGRPMDLHAEAILLRIRRAATKDRLSARWLRKDCGGLTVEQRLALVGASEVASETIVKCLAMLGLATDHDPAASADPLAALRSLIGSPAVGASPPNATGKAPGDFAAESTQSTNRPAGTLPSFSEKPGNDSGEPLNA